MTKETPPNAERESAAEFAGRLHGKLSTLLLAQPYGGDAHYAYLQAPATRLRLSDYFFYEHVNYRRVDAYEEQPEPMRAALANGSAILSLQAENKALYPELTNYVILRPVDLVRGGMFEGLLQASGVDMASEGYIIWASGIGAVQDPRAYPIIVDSDL
jgi:hypothetical protein